jgi:hypothetical protein
MMPDSLAMVPKSLATNKVRFQTAGTRLRRMGQSAKKRDILEANQAIACLVKVQQRCVAIAEAAQKDKS